MAPFSARNPRKEQEWRGWMERWQKSGQSVRAFCTAHGLSEPSFYSWRRALSRRSAPQPAFVPVRLLTEPAEAASFPVEVLLSNGRRLRVTADCDAATLARFVQAIEPVDCRRSFDGLAEQVRQQLHHDPLSGHVFVFRNKRGDRVKLLYWDEDGFVLVYKRLEEGTFAWPKATAESASVTLRAAELAMLLDGIDWTKARRRHRYHRPATATA
jgi:transposase